METKKILNVNSATKKSVAKCVQVGFTLIFCSLFFSAKAQSDTIEKRRWESRASAVIIYRDRFGVPHIYGKTDADAVFGMLYAQCEDGFERVEMNYLTALGRVSEIKGEDFIWQDLRSRIFFNQEDAKDLYLKADPEMKELLEAFADGINYFLFTHPSVKPKLLTRFEPWMHLLFSEGSIGGDVSSVSLSGLKSFYTGGQSVGQTDVSDLEIRDGSNGLAISPQKSVSGKSLFYINPHTTFYFRAEMHMVSDRGFNGKKGMNAYGAATWGQMFLYQGFNGSCGWMHTSSAADVIDHYREKISRSANGFQYQFDGKELPVVGISHSIKFLNKGMMEELSIPAYFTHHGPVVAAKDGDWIAVRLMNRPLDALRQSFLRMKADGYDEFRETMDIRTNSSNNTVYADSKGNIAYWHGNFMPRRDTTIDWSGLVDGTSTSTEWRGLHEQNEMIHILNPASGWIQNCNSTPFTATGYPEQLRKRFPAYMAPDSENFRGLHAIGLLSRASKQTMESLRTLAFDPYLPGFENMVPGLVAAVESNRGLLKQDLLDAAKILKAWDFKASKESVAMTIAMVTGRKMVEKISSLPGTKPTDNIGMVRFMNENLSDFEKIKCLASGLEDLEIGFGGWRVAWGDLNRFQRPVGIENRFDDQQASLPSGLGSGFWGALATFESRSYGTKKWYGNSGNSFVAVVEFGKKVSAKSILVGGQNCDPGSSNFSNQAESYLEGKFKDVLFYKNDVLRGAVVNYKPGNNQSEKN